MITFWNLDLRSYGQLLFLWTTFVLVSFTIYPKFVQFVGFVYDKPAGGEEEEELKEGGAHKPAQNKSDEESDSDSDSGNYLLIIFFYF